MTTTWQKKPAHPSTGKRITRRLSKVKNRHQLSNEQLRRKKLNKKLRRARR